VAKSVVKGSKSGEFAKYLNLLMDFMIVVGKKLMMRSQLLENTRLVVGF
jgi:hypothetical protein